MAKTFDVVIERDEEGFYVASIPQLPGCNTQAASLDQAMERIQEAAALYIEVRGIPAGTLDFVGIQRITVAA